MQGVIPDSFVNHYQDKDERAAKYAYIRSLGFNSYEARKLRDWRDEFIQWYYERWILRKEKIENNPYAKHH